MKLHSQTQPALLQRLAADPGLWRIRGAASAALRFSMLQHLRAKRAVLGGDDF